MKRIKILESALRDLRSGTSFYNRSSLDVGSYFRETLISEIDSLEKFAGIHSVRLGYHRLLSKRFPFAIYYQIESDVVVVYRVLDCREDPEKRDQKLKSKRTRRSR